MASGMPTSVEALSATDLTHAMESLEHALCVHHIVFSLVLFFFSIGHRGGEFAHLNFSLEKNAQSRIISVFRTFWKMIGKKETKTSQGICLG
jgi:hypothetical protein